MKLERKQGVILLCVVLSTKIHCSYISLPVSCKDSYEFSIRLFCSTMALMCKKKHVSHSLNTVDFHCSRLLGYARMLKCPVQFKSKFKICSEIEFYLLEIFCDNGQHPALGSRCCTHHLTVLNFMHWQMLPVCESWVLTRPQFILSRPGALPNVQYSTAIWLKFKTYFLTLYLKHWPQPHVCSCATNARTAS